MGASMFDTALMKAAGVPIPKNAPTPSSTPSLLKPNFKKLLRIQDEQDFVNRYQWHNIPSGLNAHLLERILYYKGSAAFFYLESLDKFFFLPYTLDGTIDCYGRFTGITPLPFMGSTKLADGKEKPFIPDLTLTPAYDIILPESLTLSDLINSCVILNDYTPQLSQTLIPRSELQDPLLDLMAHILPYTRTALLNSTGIQGLRVDNADAAANVSAASAAIDAAALNGEKYVPILGPLDFQTLTNQGPSRIEDYLVSLQSLDNLRLQALGLDNGGIFQKKAHLLEEESRMTTTDTHIIYQDGLTLRQEFCDIVNSIWGLGIWCTDTSSDISPLPASTPTQSQSQSQEQEQEVPADDNSTDN